jgi:hypothetical protein
MTKSPTAIEFKETVRHAFGYLGREFAFREVEPPTKHIEVNPFLVWFANATTLVQVEGINYGFAAQVILGPADAGDEWHATVPLWAIIKHRRPALYEDALGHLVSSARFVSTLMRSGRRPVMCSEETFESSLPHTPSLTRKGFINSALSRRRPGSTTIK